MEEAPFGVVLKKYYLKRNQRRSFRVNAKKKVRLIIGDDVEDKKDTIGEAVFYEEVEKKIPGGVAYERKEVDRVKFTVKNGSLKIFEYSAEKKLGTIGVRIMEGKGEVRVEQPEKAGNTPVSWR